MDWLPWLQLLATLFGPALAASVVIRGWRRNHEDASARDLASWRRTQFVEAVAPIFEEIEKLRISIDDPGISNLTFKSRAGSLRVKRHELILLGYPDFAGKLTEVVDYLVVNIGFHIEDPAGASQPNHFFQIVTDHIPRVQAELMESAWQSLGANDEYFGRKLKKPSRFKDYIGGITHPDKPLKSNPFRRFP